MSNLDHHTINALLEDLDRTRAELSAFETALITALGLPESSSRESIVQAASRTWRCLQRIVEGGLVDESPTELTGPWVEDNGPPAEARKWLCGECKAVNAPDATSCVACHAEAGPVIGVTVQ